MVWGMGVFLIFFHLDRGGDNNWKKKGKCVVINEVDGRKIKFRNVALYMKKGAESLE